MRNLVPGDERLLQLAALVLGRVHAGSKVLVGDPQRACNSETRSADCALLEERTYDHDLTNVSLGLLPSPIKSATSCFGSTDPPSVIASVANVDNFLLTSESN